MPASTRSVRWPSVTLQRSISPAAVVRALNAHLPRAIRVLSAEEVGPEFHARFRARGQDVPVSHLERRRAEPVRAPLRLARAASRARRRRDGRGGARGSIGRHDFAAFQATGSDTRDDRADRLLVNASSCARRIGRATRWSPTRCAATVPPPHGAHHRGNAGRDRARTPARGVDGRRARLARSRGRTAAPPTASVAAGLFLRRRSSTG